MKAYGEAVLGFMFDISLDETDGHWKKLIMNITSDATSIRF